MPDTFQLLLLHESQDEAELLLNALRKAGKAARAEFAHDEKGLVARLKSGKWDAILIRPVVGDCAAPKAISHAHKLHLGTPVILLANDGHSATILAGLNNGAHDVVPIGETERLLRVLEREITHLTILRAKNRLEADLVESEKRSEMLLDTAQDAVAYVTDGMHVQANGAYLELFGYTNSDDLAGVPIMDLVADSSHKDLKELLRRQQTVKAGEKNEMTCLGIHVDGKEFEARMTFSQAVYDGETCTQVLIRTNAGASDAEMEAKLKEATSNDPLTGLYNRQFFMEQVDKALVAHQEKKKPAAVLFIQLDSFTTLRTSVGIGGADQVLVSVSEVIGKLIDKKTSTLARFGDEIFTILTTIDGDKKILSLGEKIRQGLDEHLFEVQKKTLQVTASIGAAAINQSIKSSQDALTLAADAAAKIHQQKGSGNAVMLHNPADSIDASTNTGMAQHLQMALEKNQFKLYYQPILNLEDNAEETYEILLRLTMGTKELQPAEFMQAAIACNLSTKIDRWVILNALKALAEHNATGHKTRIMVTLTGESLADSSLVQWLSVALKAAKIGGESLILQFTEADVVTYLTHTGQFAKAVRALKIQTAICRFGASKGADQVLNHVGDVTYVKLDGSFMQELSTDTGRKAIAKCIKEIQAYDKRVIASHVESAAALQTLWGYGINYIQGHYVSAPASEMEYPFSE